MGLGPRPSVRPAEMCHALVIYDKQVLSRTKQSTPACWSKGKFDEDESANMVHIHCAYTEQINPAGSDPVLSRDQVGFLSPLSALSCSRITTPCWPKRAQASWFSPRAGNLVVPKLLVD